LRPFRTSAGDLPAARLADAYLREVIAEYQPEISEERAASGGDLDLGKPEELHPRKDLTVVHFQQLFRGIPVDEAGVTVRLRGNPLGVFGSEISVRYNIHPEIPPADSRFAPSRMDGRLLADLLGCDGIPTLKEVRWVVGRYEKARRLRVSGHHEFHLAEVPIEFVSGHYYVVTEVLFLIDSRPPAWRAWIEPRSAAVLLLEELVSPEFR